MSLLSLWALLFVAAPTVHSLPGTSYAIISGRASLDKTRQHQHINTVIQQIVKSVRTPEPSSAMSSKANWLPDKSPLSLPFCFVADTDSFPFVLDSGANRFIINNASLF
jgi:hypothetical protein